MNIWYEPLFTEDALEANRRGMLSAVQKHRLRQYLLVIIAMMAMLTIIGILVVYSVGRLIEGKSLFASPSVSEGILLILATVVFGVAVLITTRGVRSELASGKVDAIEGIVQFRIDDLLRMPFGVLTITRDDGTEMAIAVSQRTLQHFTAGERYRVYWMPKSRSVASAEMISVE